MVYVLVLPVLAVYTERVLIRRHSWAIDQKDQSASGNPDSDADVSSDQQSNAQSLSNDQAAKLSCYATDCNAKCKTGTNKVTGRSAASEK